MSIRETLNKYPRAAGTFGGFVFAAVAVFLIVHLSHGDANPSTPNNLYFTTDDGQTVFQDEGSKIAPFDHDGKTAYEAILFECSEGKRVVGYLQRYSPKGQTELLKLPAAKRTSLDADVMDLRRITTEVKAPGNEKWLSASSPNAIAIMANPCAPSK